MHMPLRIDLMNDYDCDTFHSKQIHSKYKFLRFILTWSYGEPYNTKIRRLAPEIEAINYKWRIDF